MPHGIFNWTFNDVKEFLTGYGFVTNRIESSHHYFICMRKGQLRQVSVPFHGNKAIKPRTLKSIILQSGIPKSEWLGK